MSSSLNGIQEHVWNRLGVRKLIAGRGRVNELVEIAVANWDHDALTSARDKTELGIVAESMAVGIKRTDQMLGNHDSRQEYGFVWAILLQALVGAIVQILIKWWLESSQNRAVLWTAKKEIVG
jgi:hypothetical protein